jgi:hypothetical protein
VHHIVLFGCTAPRNITGEVYDCMEMERECSTLVLCEYRVT